MNAPYSFYASYSFRDMVAYIINMYGNPVIGLLLGVAVVIFFLGIVKYIASAGDEKSLKRGHELMVWGVLALFTMSSLWGLVFFLQMTFGLQ